MPNIRKNEHFKMCNFLRHVTSKTYMYSSCTTCKEKMIAINTDINDKRVKFWFKWILKSHEYVKRQSGCPKTIVTKKYRNDKFIGTIETLVKQVKEELHASKSNFNLVNQHLTKRVKEDEIIIIFDFSENYTSNMSEEICTFWC